MLLISATAVNQDGRSSSLTAPNGPSQQTVMGTALLRAESRPEEMSFLEMHGTGTALGDPIEAGAACSVLSGGAVVGNPLAWMASKSVAGHSEPAGGWWGCSRQRRRACSERPRPSTT